MILPTIVGDAQWDMEQVVEGPLGGLRKDVGDLWIGSRRFPALRPRGVIWDAVALPQRYQHHAPGPGLSSRVPPSTPGVIELCYTLRP